MMSNEQKIDIQGELDAFYANAGKRADKKRSIMVVGLVIHFFITAIALFLVGRPVGGDYTGVASFMKVTSYAIVLVVSFFVLIVTLGIISVLRYNVDCRQKQDLEDFVKRLKDVAGYSRKETEQRLVDYPNKEDVVEILDLVFDGKKKEEE